MQSSDCESNINFGAIIYNRRVAIGWKRSVLAAEYGRALDESIQEETIKAMEERNSVPMKHRKRRAILAALLHLPPAALGLTVLERLPSIRLGTIEVGQSLDLRAYHVKLKDAWENGAVWSIDMVEDVVKSIVCLQHGKGDRKEVTRLLCGYNTLAGDTFSELGFLDTSLMYHDNAITLANESKTMISWDSDTGDEQAL